MIPQRLYDATHRTMVKAHLKRLQDRDRYLRFSTMLPDEAIDEYVNRSWKTDDAWFGIIEDDEVIAAVHMAYEDKEHRRAELGLSVDPDWRGKKLGQALFERAVFALKARGVRDVFMHCLSENAIIKHIARKNEMVMLSQSGETDADLHLPEPTPIDIGANLIVEQLAIYDSSLRSIRSAWKSIYENT